MTALKEVIKMKNAFKVLGIIALVAAIGLSIAACGSSPRWANVTFNGENEPLLEGTTWKRTAPVYDYDSIYEFRAGGRITRSDSDGDNYSGTW